MKKESSKSTETQLLELLKKVLPKATHFDPKLAGKILQAVELELKAKSRVNAFEKFCARVEVPDLEPATLDQVKKELVTSFGDADVTLKPNRKEKSLAVEIALPDGAQFSGELRVNPDAGAIEDDEELPVAKFIPFPVCLPGDRELVWMLARRENSRRRKALWGSPRRRMNSGGSKTGTEIVARPG